MRMSSVKLLGDHLVVFEGADDFPLCFSSRRCSQILVVVRCAGKVLGQEVFDEGNLEGVLPDDFLNSGGPKWRSNIIFSTSLTGIRRAVVVRA